MLKEYQELQEMLEAAKAKALAIQKKGGPTERVYRGLDAHIGEVRRRVQFMREAAGRDEAVKKAAAIDAEKAEAAPSPQPSRTKGEGGKKKNQ